LRVDRSDVIQLAGAAFAISKGITVDRHADVRSLPGHLRPVGRVQPLPADLAQGVGPSLGQRSVVPLPQPGLGIQNGSKGRQERFSRLRIEVTVDPNHPEERDGRMQAAPRPDLLVALEGMVLFHRLAPVRCHPLEIVHGVDPSGLHQLRLTVTECRRIGVAGGDQDAHGRHGELPFVQGPPGLGHLLQGPSQPHLFPGRAPRHLEDVGQPRRRGQMAVAFEHPPALYLRQPAKALDFQHLRRPLQLGEVILDAGVRQLRQGLGPEPLDSGPKLAHLVSSSNIRSDSTQRV
jgi:hypothetical protein